MEGLTYKVTLAKGELEVLETILRDTYDYRTEYNVATLEDAALRGVLKQIVDQWKEADK